MWYKNTSSGWKMSTSIHWPQLVLEFFTPWPRFQLWPRNLFKSHPNWITVYASIVTNFCNTYSYLYCCTYLNLIYIDYLCQHVISLWYQFNSTKFIRYWPRASHTAGCQYSELRRVHTVVLFSSVSLVFLSIMKRHYVFTDWWDQSFHT